jgi:hypothetical protein
MPDDTAAAWRERAWYATVDNTILGVLSARAGVRYTWLVLTGEDGLTIGIGSVRPTGEDATAALLDEMRLAHRER